MSFRSNIHFVALILSLVLVASSLFAQEGSYVTGTVSDPQGATLIGAYVLLVESGERTVTDPDGKYKIRGALGQTLEFAYMGMITKRIKIRSLQTNVVLEDDSKQVDQVVITGYQKVRNRVYTGAAVSARMNEIKMEGIADVTRMLEGRLPGLNVQSISGTFGAAPRINIRGGASILGNVQPLWVIDGAVYEDLVHLSLDELASGDAVTLVSSAIAGLNPADIEDIQVLKDASATSVYGARALNGVIIVTTKSGRREQPLRVTYSTENTLRLKPRYSEFDLLNSQETMALYQEMADKGYFSLRDALYGRRSGIYYQMFRDLSTINPKTGSFYLANTEEARTEYLKKGEYANTDWLDLLFTYNPTTNHALTFTGGSKNIATYASLGYYYDAGWTIADRVRKLSANLKNTFYITEKLKATLSAQGNFRSQTAPGTLPQRRNHAIGSFERDFDINPFSYALGTSRTLRPYRDDGEREYYRNNWTPFNICLLYTSDAADD